LPENGQDINSV